MVQPRKTRPYITERLVMGRKESNQKVPFCSHISKCRFSFDVAHILIRIHMYVLCMMLYIILNNTIHRGRTKIEIKKKVRRTKVQVF